MSADPSLDPLDSRPVILAVHADHSPLAGVSQAVTFGLASVVGAAAQAADLVPLQAETLLRHLHRKLHGVALAKHRGRWVGGRLYNALMGPAQMYHIELSGAQLRQVLALFEQVPPKGVIPREKYLLRVDVARAAHDALGKRLGVAPQKLAGGLDDL